MNYKGINLVVSILILLSPLTANASNIWTADIASVYAYSDGRAKVFLKNLTEGKNGGVDTGCTSNGVWLSPSPSKVATTSALSVALTMFASKTPVRIAIDGSGPNCTLINMGAKL